MDAPVILHLKVPKESVKGPQSAESVLAGINELFKHHHTPVSLEIVVKAGFLYFFVVCDRAFVDLVRGQFFAQYPNLEIQEVTDYMSALSHATSIALLRLERPDVYPMKIYKQLDTDFLSNLSGMATSVNTNETAMIQLTIVPIDKESMAYKIKRMTKNYWLGSMRKNSALRESLEEAEMEKYHKPLFTTSLRVIADAGNKSQGLTASITSLFKILENPNLNSLKLWKTTRSSGVFFDIKLRKPAKKTFTLASDELATIFHLPSQETGISQVAVTKSKTSEAPINLPVKPDVLPFAVTNFRGNPTEFGIKREDRRKHLYVIGKTGVGKSKLIELLALADIRENKGCVIMDPHGDLSEEMLRYIPRERLYDIIYFNPADTEFPMSFNPLEDVGSFEFKQNIVAGFIAIFKKLFSFTWNQRLEHVLRFTTLALLDVPGTTVLGITKMLSDTKYRQEIISQIQDPLVKKFWTTEFSSWNDQYAGEAITPIINKVGQFVANPIIRNIVGQKKSSIKLDEIINGGKILIANFSIGKLGEENSALLGAMFVTKLWQAAVARASIPERDRKDTFLYIDEFQNFATGAFANILSEARKYKLNLTVAHQYIAQLPDEVRSTIFGNVGTIITFRIGGEDAAIFEKEYTPTFGPKDLMSLDMRNFYIKMTVDGQTAVPFSGRTVDFPKPDEDLIHDVVRISRERWAKPKALVENEISQQELFGATAPIEEKRSFSEPLI